MRIVRTVADLEAYLDGTIAVSGFKREPVAISDQDEWLLRDGVLTHHTGSFFQIVGYQPSTGPDALMLYQPQSAINGIALHRGEDGLYILLQARVEPGNTRIGNVGPTVQSTAGNYMRLHKGKATTCLDLFFGYSPNARPIWNSNHYDLGSFYLSKLKMISVVETRDWVDTEENMIWVRLDALIEALRMDHLINTDLRSALVAIDWAKILNTPEPQDIEQDLTPLLVPSAGSARQPGHILPLSELTGWEMVDDGIRDIDARGRSARLWRVEAINREVAAWTQPLLACDRRQRATLLVRGWDSASPEFLITTASETGVSNSDVLLPSYCDWDGEAQPDAVRSGRVIRDCVQSEEGGRFMEVETRYQLIEVEADHAAAPNQAWLNGAEYAAVLRASNRPSMLLRCLSSLVLERLYPTAFASMNPDR